MPISLAKSRTSLFSRLISLLLVFIFPLSLIIPPVSYAQTVLNLPLPGTMVSLSAGYAPAILKGIKIFPENPLRFDFILDVGDHDLKGEKLEDESTKLIKYFLASLTIPEEDMWVNLSPYEKDRIIPQEFSKTEMGRDLLAQDYLLKQITASLIYPEDELGEKFWDAIYQKAHELYGTNDIPVNTFNKVWIVPEKAVVYVNGDSAYVVESHLKAMLEEDYTSLRENLGNKEIGTDQLDQGDVELLNSVSSGIIKDVILPAIEKEVNQGQNFAALRQIYNSMILATWFKRNLRESVLGRIYVGKNKVEGVDIQDKKAKEKIYAQYLEAFKRGVYNYIKEDYDPVSQVIIPRKYFSGGFDFGRKVDAAMVETRDLKQLDVGGETTRGLRLASVNFSPVGSKSITRDSAMVEKSGGLNLFVGDLKNKVLIERGGQYQYKDAIRTNTLSGNDRRKMAKALLEMSKNVSEHKILLMLHADKVLNGDRNTDSYAVIERLDDQWQILALQIVNLAGFENTRINLATWISAEPRTQFVANQVLAYALKDLLKRGFQEIDSTNVAYTPRIRRNLPQRVNNSMEVLRFLGENARGVLSTLTEAAATNSSARLALERIQSSSESDSAMTDESLEALLTSIKSVRVEVETLETKGLKKNAMFAEYEELLTPLANNSVLSKILSRPMDAVSRRGNLSATKRSVQAGLGQAENIISERLRSTSRYFDSDPAMGDDLHMDAEWEGHAEYLAKENGKIYRKQIGRELPRLLNIRSSTYKRGLEGVDEIKNLLKAARTLSAEDQNRIVNVFGHLYDNAADAVMVKIATGDNPQYNGRIDWKLSLKTDGTISVSVHDNGVGFSEEVLLKYMTKQDIDENGQPIVIKLTDTIKESVAAVAEDIQGSPVLNNQRGVSHLKIRDSLIGGYGGFQIKVDSQFEGKQRQRLFDSTKEKKPEVKEGEREEGTAIDIEFRSSKRLVAGEISGAWKEIKSIQQGGVAVDSELTLSETVEFIIAIRKHGDVNTIKLDKIIDKISLLKQGVAPEQVREGIIALVDDPFLGSELLDLVNMIAAVPHRIKERAETVIKLLEDNVPRSNDGGSRGRTDSAMVDEGREWHLSKDLTSQKMETTLNDAFWITLGKSVLHLSNSGSDSNPVVLIEQYDHIYGTPIRMAELIPNNVVYTIGRSSAHDFVLTDEKVSRDHVRITVNPGSRFGQAPKIEIEDTSQNGTFIQTERAIARMLGESGSGISQSVDSAESDPAMVDFNQNRRDFLSLSLKTVATIAILGAGGIYAYKEIKESSALTNHLIDLSERYGQYYRTKDYLKFMDSFLRKRTAKSLKEFQDGQYHPFLKIRNNLEYRILAQYVGILLRENASYELLGLITKEDIDFLFLTGNEEMLDDFILRMIDKGFSVNQLNEMQKRNLPIGRIGARLLNKLTNDWRALETVRTYMDQASQIDLSPQQVREKLESIIHNSGIQQSMEKVEERVKKMRQKKNPDYKKRIENDYTLRLFTVYLANYTFDYVLKQLNADSHLTLDQLKQIKNLMADKIYIKFAPLRAMGSLDREGFIEINLNYADNIPDLFDVSTHEAIHRLASDEELNSQLSISGHDDIKWILASTYGHYVQLMTRGMFHEDVLTETFLGRTHEKNLFKKRNDTPDKTHFFLRSLFLLESAIPGQYFNWEEAKKHIETSKGGLTFGDEPYFSYLEGEIMAVYAAFHFGRAGEFFVKLYGTRHEDLNFAQMELAATILENLIDERTTTKERLRLENEILERIKKEQLTGDIKYPELEKISSGISTELRSSAVQSSSTDKALLGAEYRSVKSHEVQKGNDSSEADVGGIDLNPDMMRLDTRGQGVPFSFPVNMDELEAMPFSGFTPVILRIVPVTNLPLLLGINESDSPFDSAQEKIPQDSPKSKVRLPRLSKLP